MADPLFNLNYWGIDWLAMFLSLTAIYSIGDKKRYGFLIFMTGNCLWVTVGILAHSHAMVATNICLFLMHVRGYLKWKPEK